MAYIAPHKRHSRDVEKPSPTAVPVPRALKTCSMAYIAPHKGHSRDVEKPSPSAELLAPQFNRKFNLNPSGPKVDKTLDMVYATQSITKWFSIGSSGDGKQFSSLVHLEPFSMPDNDSSGDEKPFALIPTNISQGIKEEEEEGVTRPWESIVENILPDLLSTVEHVKNRMNNFEDVKPNLVARIGKVIFYRSPEVHLNKMPAESGLRQMRKIFYTNVPETYMEHITEQVIPLIGVEFEEEKDIYRVMLSDAKQPKVILSCKCKVLPESNNLSLYKVELNAFRHMVADVSCLGEHMDMRLMLYSQKTLTKEKLKNDVMEGIVDLINSAVVDQDVKGGLKWPLGKAFSGDRFRVVEVWHTVAKSYVNPSVKLNVRNANRYNFTTSFGKAAIEVTLKLKQVTSELLREKVETEVISDLLNDQLKLFWNLVCGGACSSAPSVSA